VSRDKGPLTYLAGYTTSNRERPIEFARHICIFFQTVYTYGVVLGVMIDVEP
jgi:hypothetical protein